MCAEYINRIPYAFLEWLYALPERVDAVPGQLATLHERLYVLPGRFIRWLCALPGRFFMWLFMWTIMFVIGTYATWVIVIATVLTCYRAGVLGPMRIIDHIQTIAEETWTFTLVPQIFKPLGELIQEYVPELYLVPFILAWKVIRGYCRVGFMIWIFFFDMLWRFLDSIAMLGETFLVEQLDYVD